MAQPNQQRKQQMRKQRRERKERQRFTQPMTERRAGQTANAQTNLAYGDTQRQNTGLIRASKQREGEVGNWYQNFANEVAASRDAVNAAYAQANQTNTANIQGVAGADQARQAEVTQAANQFGQMTGGPGVTPQEAQTNAAAGQQRQLYGSILAAPVAAQGANAFAYLTNQRTAVQGEGISQKLAEGKRRAGLQADRKALLKEKGQYRATKLDELRKAERDYKVQLRAFPLEEQKLGQEAADSAADRALEEQKLRQQREENKEDNASTGNSDAQDQKRKQEQNWNNARAAARTLYERPKGWNSWAALTKAVMEQSEVGPALARKAVEQIRKRVEREEEQQQIEVSKDPSPNAPGR